MPSPAEYLTLPYEWVLIPDEASGTFTALIREFPGCVSQGDSPAEAYANLEDAAKAWIGAALDLGQSIPAPRAVESHGGRVLLRLPRSLHREASEAAERDGTSLNQFIVAAVAYRLGGKAAEAAGVVAAPSAVASPRRVG